MLKLSAGSYFVCGLMEMKPVVFFDTADLDWNTMKKRVPWMVSGNVPDFWMNVGMQ